MSFFLRRFNLRSCDVLPHAWAQVEYEPLPMKPVGWRGMPFGDVDFADQNPERCWRRCNVMRGPLVRFWRPPPPWINVAQRNSPVEPEEDEASDEEEYGGETSGDDSTTAPSDTAAAPGISESDTDDHGMEEQEREDVDMMDDVSTTSRGEGDDEAEEGGEREETANEKETEDESTTTPSNDSEALESPVSTSSVEPIIIELD